MNYFSSINLIHSWFTNQEPLIHTLFHLEILCIIFQHAAKIFLGTWSLAHQYYEEVKTEISYKILTVKDSVEALSQRCSVKVWS